MRRPWSPYVLLFLLVVVFPGAPAPANEASVAQDAAAAYREALRLEAAGEEALARRALERTVALEPEHRAARRALGYEDVDGYWLKGDDLLRAKGFVHHGGRWITAEAFADATRPRRHEQAQREGEARVLRLLARVATGEPERARAARRHLGETPVRFQLAPLAQAMRCEPPSLRIFAAERLGRLGDVRAVPALLRRAVHDPVVAVRSAAVRALREIDTPGTVRPLARALWSRHADVRVRAAEALAGLGDAEAAAYVIARWEKRSGDFPRVYLSQVNQVSFIQDFDVEVASTSFIADPIVGVLQEGVVMPVHVLATEQTFSSVERVAYRQALGRLASEDHGDDVAAWRRWWEERRRR